jgi:hypothetical protein
LTLSILLPPLKMTRHLTFASEMMARLMVAAGQLKDKKRKVSAACIPFATTGG